MLTKAIRGGVSGFKRRYFCACLFKPRYTLRASPSHMDMVCTPLYGCGAPYVQRECHHHSLSVALCSALVGSTSLHLHFIFGVSVRACFSRGIHIEYSPSHIDIVCTPLYGCGAPYVRREGHHPSLSVALCSALGGQGTSLHIDFHIFAEQRLIRANSSIEMPLLPEGVGCGRSCRRLLFVVFYPVWYDAFYYIVTELCAGVFKAKFSKLVCAACLFEFRVSGFEHNVHRVSLETAIHVPVFDYCLRTSMASQFNFFSFSETTMPSLYRGLGFTSEDSLTFVNRYVVDCANIIYVNC